jgi:hypothetical protein
MTQKIRIASPCSADWNRMSGTKTVRYCPDCNLNVYTFSRMSSTEIDHLVSHHEGRLCVRYYQRPDGTMLTQNCPVGLRAAVHHVSRLATATLSAVLTIFSATAAASPRPQKSAQPLHQIQKAPSQASPY